jgi:hypothetical protein
VTNKIKVLRATAILVWNIKAAKWAFGTLNRGSAIRMFRSFPKSEPGAPGGESGEKWREPNKKGFQFIRLNTIKAR